MLGAGNIGRDDTVYADGAITREGTAGESTAATRPADDPVITSTGVGLSRGPRLRVAAFPDADRPPPPG